MSPIHVVRAVRMLRRGGVIAYPNEGVYGLGCDPMDREAVARLLRVKRRDAVKGLIVIGADLAQLERLVRLDDPAVRARVAAPAPHPITWVVPARRGVPDSLTGGRGTLAVRVSGHPVAAALCRRFGAAIVSTSANRSGRPPARAAAEVRRRLGARLDAVVPGRIGTAAGPSEIRDARDGRVLRPGAGG